MKRAPSQSRAGAMYCGSREAVPCSPPPLPPHLPGTASSMPWARTSAGATYCSSRVVMLCSCLLMRLKT